ncbi:cation:proton antiporter subunit C [Fusibacter bizertensis]|jgi:Multisubunit Na+/H+ antiporter, MnhC subunit|uniref:Cation:proton antiporter subunit C n=1 Tax=Fusibacter bizertensis TaxID=1488331 RepID=A0ABT6NBH9_9FIRM|nr:cation:proton antiporter subunit C [Fusibacter bizertensis]MDH8677759.1 cation:proton antiporter subunit C [Fusibacter bizertensis]
MKEYLNGENVSICIFFIGVYGLCARRNILKTIISMSLMQAAAILYFLSSSFESGSIPPIGQNLDQFKHVADPIPQALMITAVVIGVSVTAVCLTMFVSMFHKYGTTNWNKVKKKRGEID